MISILPLCHLLLQSPEMLAGAAFFLLIIFLLALRAIKSRQRSRLFVRMGLKGTIIYADQGRRGRYFVSKKYQIIAKPDFIVRLVNGENAIVEFKSRSNGRLYSSDMAQVKASVLAVRESMPVAKAYVLAGTKLHEVKVVQDNKALFKQVEKEVSYARRAAGGEIIGEYADVAYKCLSCPSKKICSRPGATH